LLVRVQTIRSTPSLIGPSSVWIGLSSFFVMTLTRQPGTAWYEDGGEPGRELDVDLGRRGVVALGGHPDVEDGERAGRRAGRLQRDVGLRGGRDGEGRDRGRGGDLLVHRWTAP
jgi:hypothetical protein